MIFVKNSRGGREVNMINTLSKINLSKIGWEGGGVNLNLDNVCKYAAFFFDGTPYPLILKQISAGPVQPSSIFMSHLVRGKYFKLYEWEHITGTTGKLLPYFTKGSIN